jgi:thioredoxin 1
MSTNATNVLHPTASTFKAEVLDSAQPVLVDFWAPWCPPCRALKPSVEQLATEMQGVAKFAFVNVDDQPDLAAQFRVESIPALFIIKGGKVVDSIVGMAPKATLKARLEEWAD